MKGCGGIEENAQIFDFTLSNEDMAALDALDETGGGTERRLFGASEGRQVAQ